ncbi:DEAD/DEAH box helicase [Alkalihalobacillus sp. MEB130]|uniref:DEAD/DEAH box helicase n=1 Tax=Alkalihalobacillus sp. MEB130 TaxID=2976704 RepID=UPI0028DD9066|nr:DEAD/DEAH box helicase [Alkalihalobacillus sp. MEB130]MDT8861859.1 DEAD/DEAH box helicase [Alkalihalobacillus sp. MEB130]
MEMKLTHKMIKEICGTVSYKKGDSFYRSNKVTFQEYSFDFCKATVSGKEDFHVTIEKGEAGDIQMTCSCPTLANFQKSCQHIAAVLLSIYDLQRQGTSPLRVQAELAAYGELTKDFISLFQEKVTQSSGQQRYFEKREVLNVRFTIKPVLIGRNQLFLGMEVEIGKTKVQNIREFLENVKQGKPSVGIYDPSIHCFSEETDAVIQQLIKIIHDEKAFLEAMPADTNQTLLIPPSSREDLIALFSKAPFISLMHDGHAFERFKLVEGAPPIQFTLKETEGLDYQLAIKGFERMSVLPLYRLVLCGGDVFLLEEKDCDRLFELKQMLSSPDKNIVPIPQGKIELFLTEIVPGLKKIGEVHLSKVVSQKLLKAPLVAKLYLDRLRNRLLAGLEFHYDNILIQPLESRDIARGPMVIRDVEKEGEILQLMEQSGFSKTDGGYFMQNEMLEYEFLYHVVPKLKQQVQIYATTAVRNRIFKKNAFPKIRVKVNQKDRTNWLAFTFEMNGVADKEIKEILAALEEKRKYYRLQNGSLLSLETREMEEIQHFLNAVPSQDQDWEASLNVPIIQGLKFLDSIGNSDVYKPEESFRQFLNQLQNPGNVEYEVPQNLDSVLRDYQKSGYQWMKTLASYGFGGVLADDMGLGKTVQSITFIVSELPRIRESGKPVLIVCPSSLTYNWLSELMRFAPELEAVVIDGKKEERERLLTDTKEDIIITSYPLLRQDINWYERQLFHTVFFDEAQTFKNPVTQTARAVKRLKAEQRFGLTGTPVENSIEELWSIYHVVFPQLFQGLKQYSELTRKQISTRVRPFLLRRMKEDVLSELPEKEESLVSAELFPEQKKLYMAYLAKLRHETVKHLDKDTLRKNRIKILAGITRLRQICCHPALFVDGYKGSSAKFEQLLQMVEESRLSGNRVLIFSQFTKMLEIIGRELTLRGHTYFYLDGQTPSDKRLDLCNRFNDGKRELFLISLKAGGTGLNLTGADTVILYDLWWNPAVEEQAADRVHRMGQNKRVKVIKLVARGTIEEKMNELQEKKRDLIAEVVDSQEQGSVALTEEDIREILM